MVFLIGEPQRVLCVVIVGRRGTTPNAYFQKDDPATNAGPHIKFNAVTDESNGAPNSQASKQLPRHRRLLAEAELRRIFNHIVEQPVPKELLDLLQRIDARCIIGAA